MNLGKSWFGEELNIVIRIIEFLASWVEEELNLGKSWFGEELNLGYKVGLEKN